MRSGGKCQRLSWLQNRAERPPRKRSSSTAGRGWLTSSVQRQSNSRTCRRPRPARFRSMSFESANGKAMQSASTEAGKHPFVEPFVEPCVIGRGKIERDVRRTNLNQMEEVSQMKPRAVPMKLRGLISGALLSLILSPVVALGRPVVASAAAADPMFQVQVPGVFKQKAFPVDATAGKSVPGVVTLADAESAFAGRGGLAASASGSLGSIFTPGAMAINLFTGGSSRAEFRLPDVTFSGPAPVGSTISATLSFDLAGTLATNALHAFTSDARLTSEASAVINGHLLEPTSFIGGNFGGQAKAVSSHLANGTLTSTLYRDGQVAAHSLCLARSEEHTSELQSRQYLVCRLLLEKKKQPGNT